MVAFGKLGHDTRRRLVASVITLGDVAGRQQHLDGRTHPSAVVASADEGESGGCTGNDRHNDDQGDEKEGPAWYDAQMLALPLTRHLNEVLSANRSRWPRGSRRQAP